MTTKRNPRLQSECLGSSNRTAGREVDSSAHASWLDYDLVGDVVFDPPLSPGELRRRFRFGIPIEERIEQARRQIAEGLDEF